MKVRIGISLGDGALDSESPDRLLEFIDDVRALGHRLGVGQRPDRCP